MPEIPGSYDNEPNINNPENSREPEMQEIWSLFENEGLKKEIKELTSQEIAAINDCAIDFVEDIRSQAEPIFGGFTKQNGPRRDEDVYVDYESFSVLPEYGERVERLGKALLKQFVDKNQNSLIPAAAGIGDLRPLDLWSIKIFPHPEEPQLIIIRIESNVPSGNTYGDSREKPKKAGGRSVGCNLNITLSKDSKVIRFLKKYPNYVRDFPFMIRNAAVALNRDLALKYLDAPIGASEGTIADGYRPEKKKRGHRINIADFRDLSIITASDDVKVKPNIVQAKNLKEFAENAKNRSIGKESIGGLKRKVQVKRRIKGWISSKEIVEEEEKEIPIEEANYDDLKNNYYAIIL